MEKGDRMGDSEGAEGAEGASQVVSNCSAGTA